MGLGGGYSSVLLKRSCLFSSIYFKRCTSSTSLITPFQSLPHIKAARRRNGGKAPHHTPDLSEPPEGLVLTSKLLPHSNTFYRSHSSRRPAARHSCLQALPHHTTATHVQQPLQPSHPRADHTPPRPGAVVVAAAGPSPTPPSQTTLSATWADATGDPSCMRKLRVTLATTHANASTDAAAALLGDPLFALGDDCLGEVFVGGGGSSFCGGLSLVGEDEAMPACPSSVAPSPSLQLVRWSCRHSLVPRPG